MRRRPSPTFTITRSLVGPLAGMLLGIAVVASGCSGNDNSASATSIDSGQTTTTFMPDCSLMPTAADISAIVGVPMADGTVVGSGSCQYLGANDQTKVVSLSLFLTAADQANWNDLQASLGTPTPYSDPALAGALTAPDGTLYLTANDAIYAAKVEVNGTPAPQQVPVAAQLLGRWLAL